MFRPFATLVLIGLVLGGACEKSTPVQTPTAPSQIKTGTRVGQRAPDFKLPSRDGRQIKLSQYRGKIVFLNFWATWCGPCRVEMPSMERLHQKMKGKPFEILAISVDQGGWRQIDAFVESLGLNFTILLDSDQKAARQFRSFRYPETLIIDQRGVIVDKRVGAVDWDDSRYLKFFEQLVEKITNRKK